MVETSVLAVAEAGRSDAPPRRRNEAPPAARMVLDSGSIACDFRAVAQNRRSTTYELLVANDTLGTIAAVAYPGRAGGRGQLTLSSALRVPAFSSIAVTVDFPKLAAGRQRATAELHADEGHLELRAAAFARRSSGARRLAAVAAAAAAVVALAVGARNVPHVGALVAPAAVTAGRPFDVTYAFAGARRGRYELTSRQGQAVLSGSIASDGGTFSLTAPAARDSRAYALRVVAQGDFAADARSTELVAVPPPVVRRPAPRPRAQPAPAVEVADLSLEHAAVSGGDPIRIAYKTAAASGSVRLLDQTGTVRAEALLNPLGRSVLIAPFVDATQDFRIVVSAQRGSAHAESAAGIRIVDAPPLGNNALAWVGADRQRPDAADDTGAVPWSDAGPVAIASSVPANSPLAIRVLRHERGLRVALINDAGKEIDAADVEPEDSRMALWMPPHTEGQRFTAVVSYANGTAVETRIVPVMVPR